MTQSNTAAKWHLSLKKNARNILNRLHRFYRFSRKSTWYIWKYVNYHCIIDFFVWIIDNSKWTYYCCNAQILNLKWWICFFFLSLSSYHGKESDHSMQNFVPVNHYKQEMVLSSFYFTAWLLWFAGKEHLVFWFSCFM